MTALYDAFELTSNEANWADEIQMNRLEEHQKKNNKTVILLRNATNAVGVYGSNKLQFYMTTIQVQIFYSLDAGIGDFEDLEIQLIKAYEKNGWLIQGVRGRVNDPDTNQLTQTILIKTKKEV